MLGCTSICLNASICLHGSLYIWIPPYVWTSPLCLDTSHMFGCYEGHPNIWIVSKYMVVSKHTGDIQTYGGIQMYRWTWTPPQSDKACFICVVYVQWASKHLLSIHGGIQTYRGIQTYWGIQTYRGLSKHMGHPNIWGCPNIWGNPNIQRASKHMGGVQTYGGIKTYKGHPNIQGAIQTYGGIQKCSGCMQT